jgi:hypothetical protein
MMAQKNWKFALKFNMPIDAEIQAQKIGKLILN